MRGMCATCRGHCTSPTSVQNGCGCGKSPGPTSRFGGGLIFATCYVLTNGERGSIAHATKQLPWGVEGLKRNTVGRERAKIAAAQCRNKLYKRRKFSLQSSRMAERRKDFVGKRVNHAGRGAGKINSYVNILA